MKSSVMETAMFVLVVLLAAGFHAAAAASYDTNTIRLTGGGSLSAGGPPWDCCDWVEQMPDFRPPRWRCNDVAESCSPDCRECVESVFGDGYVCNDWVTWLLEPPVCTPRPWDCCDVALCTRSLPPICQCRDMVEVCPSNCKKCEVVEGSDPPSYRCLDTFNGFPGPKCTPSISSNSN